MAAPEYLTKDDAEELISRTVKKTLTTMGVDTSNPLEMQRDFQALRDWRTAMTTTKRWVAFTVITLSVTGLVSALIVGIKYAIKN